MAEDTGNKELPNPVAANAPSTNDVASESDQAENRRRRRWFWRVVIGSFICQIAIISLFTLLSSIHNAPFSFGIFDSFLLALRWGTLLAVPSTVAFVAVWGILAGPYRLFLASFLGVIAVGSIVSTLYYIPLHTLIIAMIVAFLVFMYCALLFLTAWLTRVRLLETNIGAGLLKTKPTFSLQYLGGWSIFFAIILAVVRQIVGGLGNDDQTADRISVLLILSILFASSFFLANLTQFSVLGTNGWWLRLLGLFAPIFAVTFLEFHALSYVPRGEAPFFLVLSFNAVQLGWIASMCGLVRWAGYRLAAR